jgi:hypothetical protein
VRIYDLGRGININLSFGTDVGGWIVGKNKDNTRLGKELVRNGQNALRHDRFKMANPVKWKDIVKDFVKKHNLEVDEWVT